MGCEFDYSLSADPLVSRLKAEAFPRSPLGERLETYLRHDILPFLDEKFPAVQVMGSHVKGYATEKSDVDFKLYCNGPSIEEARRKYLYLQRRMRRAKWRPCHWGGHIDDHHIVAIDCIKARELAPSAWVPRGLYGFIGRHDLVWITGPTRRCMEIADLFTPGMVEHASMESYRMGVLDDLLENPRAAEVWSVADRLYRGHTSRINRARIGISRTEQRSIEAARYEKFGLPPIENVFWWRHCNKGDGDDD